MVYERFGDSKSGSSITRKEGLAPSRRPFKNGTKKTHIIFQINEHAFIYLILIKWDAQILLRTSELFKRQSSSVRNKFKVTPI